MDNKGRKANQHSSKQDRHNRPMQMSLLREQTSIGPLLRLSCARASVRNGKILNCNMKANKEEGTVVTILNQDLEKRSFSWWMQYHAFLVSYILSFPVSLRVISSEFVYHQNAQYSLKHKCSQRNTLI